MWDWEITVWHLLEPVPGRRTMGVKTRKFSVTISEDLLAWVEARIGNGREFASISHALERGIVALQKAERK